MPEHLDARTTISRDMFYCTLASKLPLQNKKNKNLPPDHKISEKTTLTNYFLLLGLILKYSRMCENCGVQWCYIARPVDTLLVQYQ